MKTQFITGTALIAALLMTSPAFAKGAGVIVGGNAKINATEKGPAIALAISHSRAVVANGAVGGDVNIGGNLEINATRKKAAIALAISHSTACALNGVISSNPC